MLQPDDTNTSEIPHTFLGHFFYRVDGGQLGTTEVLLAISSEQVTLRYSDGIEHVGRRGDDVVTFFANGLAPSLLQNVASPRAADHGEPR